MVNAVNECTDTDHQKLRGVALAIRLAKTERMLETARNIPVPCVLKQYENRTTQLARMVAKDDIAQNALLAARLYMRSVSKREEEFQKSFLGRTMTLLEEVIALRYPGHSAAEDILLEGSVEKTNEEKRFSQLEMEFRDAILSSDEERCLKALFYMLVIGKVEVVYRQDMPPLEARLAMKQIAVHTVNARQK